MLHWLILSRSFPKHLGSLCFIDVTIHIDVKLMLTYIHVTLVLVKRCNSRKIFEFIWAFKYYIDKNATMVICLETILGLDSCTLKIPLTKSTKNIGHRTSNQVATKVEQMNFQQQFVIKSN